VRDPDDICDSEIQEGRGQQNSVSHSFQGVDNTRRGIASSKLSEVYSRHHFYGPGVPAHHGQHYRALVRFARKHAGSTVLDVGCGHGAYGYALSKEGPQCFGCDINEEYLREAVQHGFPVAAVDSILPFPDRSFDTVLLFEVIEHVPDLQPLLKEAFRVARRNVLVTVPNSEDIEVMKSNDVTYAHMLSSDHVNFFDAASLRKLLLGYASDVSVERSDPIYPFWFVGRSIPFYGLRLLYRAGVLRPRFYSRLYAVARICED
jgi:SAM-dependent methyltransferase